YTRARAEATGIKMESIGIAERAERIIILAIASLTAILWTEALNIGIITLAILTNLTVLQRTLHVYNKTRQKHKTKS
ncbi:CDP-alcohol phosphatidyltransferase family protein, partial [Candidatus Bathyarchaeota archaeon]